MQGYVCRPSFIVPDVRGAPGRLEHAQEDVDGVLLVGVGHCVAVVAFKRLSDVVGFGCPLALLTVRLDPRKFTKKKHINILITKYTSS